MSQKIKERSLPCMARKHLTIRAPPPPKLEARRFPEASSRRGVPPRAGTIADPVLRRGFLQNIPWHCEIVAASTAWSRKA